MKLFRRKKAKRAATTEDAAPANDEASDNEAPNDGGLMAEYGLESLFHGSETLMLGLLGIGAALARSRWQKRGR